MELLHFISDDSIDHIVFEGRNKNYGAYVIRKGYPKDLGLSLILALTGLALLFIVPPLALRLIGGNELSQSKELKIKRDNVYEIKTINIPPKTKVELPKEKESTVPQKSQKTADSKPVVVENTVEEIQNVPNPVGNETANSTIPKPAEGPISGLGTIGGTSNIDQRNDTLLWTKIMPAFDGDLSKFISRNLIYPDIAQRRGTEGTVYLSFVIDKEGNVKSVKPLNPKPIGDGCEEAAINTVNKMPKWKPGRNENGEVVSVRFTLPIKFILR